MLLDKWIADGVFKPNQVCREPTEEERRDSRFCCLHNFVQLPTAEYWALRRLVHRRIKEGTLELSQPKVQRNPFPNDKGKEVSVVVICADPGEDEEERPALPAATITTLQKSSTSMMRRLNQTSLRTFLDAAFIRNSKSFCQTSLTLTFLLSSTVGNGGHCVMSRSPIHPYLFRSSTSTCIDFIF